MCRSGVSEGFVLLGERERERKPALCGQSTLGRLCSVDSAGASVHGTLCSWDCAWESCGGAGSLAAIGPLSTIGLLSEAPAEKPNLPKPQRLASVWSASLSLLSAQPFESVPGTHCSVPLLCPTTLTHYSDLLL